MIFFIQAAFIGSWLRRAQSGRAQQDQVFKERIQQVHKQADRRYGYRPIYEHLKDENIGCGRDRTLRLMKEMGIEGIQSGPDRGWQ